MVYFRLVLMVTTLASPLHADEIDYIGQLNHRFAPYADWSTRLEPERVRSSTARGWWQSPEEIRANRNDDDLPLTGLHLALDPGHIGGEWAAIEGRDFKINPDDLPVREGELVLELALMLRAELIKMGAEVSLLREGTTPVNPKSPGAYFSSAAQSFDLPVDASWASLVDYSLELRRLMNRMYAVTGELVERARIVNEVIQPDALISLHTNAAPWPHDEAGEMKYELVDSNHTHVLIFGCLSDAELSVPLQEEQLIVKMTNGSAGIERELGQALGYSLGQATALPASNYSGQNAIRLDGHTPYLWARNLLLLRYVECPVVLLEPYIANSKESYPRIQSALKTRQMGSPLAEGDILVEYGRAVVEAVVAVYGPKREQ